DQRHRLVLDGIWHPASGMLHDFLFSAIYTAESGRAVASLVSVPSIPFSTSDGVQWNGYGGLYGQGGASFLPTVPRHSVAGAWDSRLDLRVSRHFQISRVTLEAIAEGVNVFNRANDNGFNTTIDTATATNATTPLATPVVLTTSPSYLLPNSDGSQP